mmetsp:Transcript_57730/g.132578  ORF Transcript_57730/g.132578 Transcript_57730/m.132578 type:complete len:243 (+) Transcript_57730:98-826(+)
MPCVVRDPHCQHTHTDKFFSKPAPTLLSQARAHTRTQPLDSISQDFSTQITTAGAEPCDAVASSYPYSAVSCAEHTHWRLLRSRAAQLDEAAMRSLFGGAFGQRPRALLRFVVAHLHLGDQSTQVGHVDLPVVIWVELLQNLFELLCLRARLHVERVHRLHQLRRREHAVAVQVERAEGLADRAVGLLELRAQRRHHLVHALVEHRQLVLGRHRLLHLLAASFALLLERQHLLPLSAARAVD